MLKDSSAVKLTFKQRFDYAFFDGAYMMLYYWVNAFMSIFYTDVVGVSVSAVAALTLFVRIFDAANDPIIGSIADRTNSPKGKYTPWLKYGGLALGISMILLFAVQPSWADKAKLTWMWISYIAVTVASTCCYMPYTALNGVMTSDSDERNKLSALRNVCSAVGGQIIGVLAVPMIVMFSGKSSGADAAPGYLYSVIICTVIFTVAAFHTSGHCREVVKPVKAEKIPIKKQMSCFFKNKYAIILAITFLMTGFNQYGKMSVLAYYFQYVSGSMSYVSVNGAVVIVAGIIGSGVGSVWLYKITRHKGRAMLLAYALYGIFAIPLYFVPASNVFFWVFTALSSVSICAASGISYGMIGDVVDFGEFKYGIRVDGFLSSFISMTLKAGGAIGPAVMLLLLDKVGFMPNAVNQAQAVINVMSGSMSWMPFVTAMVACVALAFYNMDEKKLVSIREALQQKAE